MKKSWDDVFAMNVVEFLNVICYLNDKAEEDKRRMDQWKKTH